MAMRVASRVARDANDHGTAAEIAADLTTAVSTNDRHRAAKCDMNSDSHSGGAPPIREMPYACVVHLETLFLDAGGVLVGPNWDRVRDALAHHGVAAPADALAGAELHAKRQLDEDGTIRATNDGSRGWVYFHLVLEKLGIPRSAETGAALAELHAYHQQRNLWESVLPGAREGLAAFRTLGLRLVVVSNANGTLAAHFDRLGLTSAVDLVLDSQVEGVEKPNPRLFQIALARSGASPDTTVHVGDLYHVDVVGARAAGLRAVLVDPAGLYEEADCPRVASLPALAEEIRAGAFGATPRSA